MIDAENHVIKDTFTAKQNSQNALNKYFQAVTANPTFLARGGWRDCDGYVFEQYNATELEMDWWFQQLIHHSNLRMLIYNGDVDTVCDFLGDEWYVACQSLASLELSRLSIYTNRSMFFPSL